MRARLVFILSCALLGGLFALIGHDEPTAHVEQVYEDPNLISNASIIVPFVLELVAFVGGGITINRARRQRMAVPFTGLLPAAAERLARRSRLLSAVLLVAMAIDLPAIARIGPNAEIIVLTLSPLLFCAGAVVLFTWINAWRALRLLARAGATAAVRHDAVIVITPMKRVGFVTRTAAIHRAQLPSVDLQ